MKKIIITIISLAVNNKMNKQLFCNKVMSIIIFLVLFGSNITAQEYSKISQRGKYEVGFQSYWLSDYSREFVHKGDTIKRPILVNIWYPAVPSDNEMKYQDYLEFPENNTQLLKLNKEYKNYNLNYINQEVFHIEDDSKPSKKDLNLFFNRTIKTYKNGLPIEKKFPLVIYHQGYGATIEDNAVLCEYLASNGYVVVGSSFFRNNYSSLSIDGRKESVLDIHYLINHFSSKKNVDISNIALVGHSGGAQASLMFKSASLNPVKALALLETTQEVYGLEDPRWNSFVLPVKGGIKNMNGSLLGFTEHKAVFKLYDLMSNAERHYITFPKSVSHNDYIAQGIYGRIHANIVNNDPASKAKIHLKESIHNYSLVNDYILKYLDLKLKDKTGFKNEFSKNSPMNFKEPQYEYMSKGDVVYRPSTPISEVPTARLIWHLAFNDDVSSIKKLLLTNKEQKEINPVYNKTFVAALLAELISKEKKSAAKKIYQIYLDLGVNPESSFIALSKISLLFKKTDYSKVLLSMLLKLNPDSKKAKEELKKINNYKVKQLQLNN